MICQLAAYDDRHLCRSLGLSPYTIIAHSVKRWQSFELVHKLRIIDGVYICVEAQGLLLSNGPGLQEVLRHPWAQLYKKSKLP
ncbi:hypothetical protein TNCV_4509261 [Trichonephila clavipes]|nr:hypothetical protein TNCV_4509261 [Trichonephila clavipes]